MVLLNELYILNLVLDGNDIFNIPSFNEVCMNALIADSVYKALNEKSLIVDSSILTIAGTELVKKISDYKKAKKYVQVGHLTLGIYKENFAIALIRKIRGCEFDFRRIKISDISNQISSSYPFLDNDNSSPCESDNNEKLSYEELITKYSLNDDNAIYLSTLDVDILKVKKKDFATNEIIFWYDGYFYYYNRNQQSLFSCTRLKIMQILEERVKINV